MATQLIDILGMKGLSQAAFARALDLSPTYLNGIIKGSRPFPIGRLEEACRLLGCRPSEVRPDLAPLFRLEVGQ